MGTFLQIVLINLVVSCDNVGVIAMATQNLPHRRAVTARRLGIFLSLALKMLFIVLVGFLFGIPWLHIRIIGGVLLLYVTAGMMRQHQNAAAPHRQGRGGDHNSFVTALVSIVAADVSMSLDNVIAILSIVSADGSPAGLRDSLLIFGGLLVCVPVLLWCSGAISRLMERYRVLHCVCAGYLVYMALHMIFADELLVLFFGHINYAFAGPTAILGGVLAGIYGCVAGVPASPRARRNSSLFTCCCLAAAYSLVSVGAICFLSTAPVVDGIPLGVEQLYHFAPSGANAVYTLGTAAELPALCAAVYIGGALAAEKLPYGPMLRHSVLCMLALVAVELAVTTAGLTATFGFGEFQPARLLWALLLQTALLCTYAVIFCTIAHRLHHRGIATLSCMLFLLVEEIVLEVCWHRGAVALSGFLPGYYISLMPWGIRRPAYLLQAVAVAAAWAAGAVCLSRIRLPGVGGHHSRQHRKKAPQTP